MIHKLLASFRPSNAKRQLTCTKSIQYDVNPTWKPSPIAELGNKLHKLSEDLLNGTISEDDVYESENDELTADLLDTVINYSDYVNALIDDYDDTILVEHRVSLDSIYNFTKSKYGSIDAVVYSPLIKKLHIVDYKTGRNRINAYQNYQMYIYAYCLLNEFDFETVELHIFQESYFQFNTNTYTISRADLKQWIYLNVQSKLKEIHILKLRYAVGDHCMYCNNLSNCTAIYNEIDIMLDNPDNIDLEEKARLFSNEKAIVKALDSYKGDLYDSLMLGDDIPGVKLVNGNKRKYINEPEIVESILLDAGFDKEDIYSMKFKTPYQLEQLLKDNDMMDCITLSDYVSQTDPKIILALATSNRKAIKI